MKAILDGFQDNSSPVNLWCKKEIRGEGKLFPCSFGNEGKPQSINNQRNFKT